MREGVGVGVGGRGDVWGKGGQRGGGLGLSSVEGWRQCTLVQASGPIDQRADWADTEDHFKDKEGGGGGRLPTASRGRRKGGKEGGRKEGRKDGDKSFAGQKTNSRILRSRWAPLADIRPSEPSVLDQGFEPQAVKSTLDQGFEPLGCKINTGPGIRTTCCKINTGPGIRTTGL